MKKGTIIIAVVALLALASFGIAFANAGPHGGYTATTDACAGCHRAHTAQGPNLLIEASTQALCLTCHGSSATGAQTNVSDGVYETTAGNNTGNPLLGGGFTNYQGSAVTSTHDISSTVTAAWGYGSATNRGTTADLAEGLDCGSCHDPHGTDGYRLLVAGPTASTQDYDSAAKSYTSEQWGDAALSAFCASCHTTYHETAANVGSDSTAWTYGNTYTHRIDMAYTYGSNVNPETVGFGGYTLPLADGTNADEVVVCTTCHLPHGTSAAMSTDAAVGPTADSALLRLDNRGVCEVCHQK